jgi:hypothetical protein
MKRQADGLTAVRLVFAGIVLALLLFVYVRM